MQCLNQAMSLLTSRPRQKINYQKENRKVQMSHVFRSLSRCLGNYSSLGWTNYLWPGASVGDISYWLKAQQGIQ